MAQDTDKADGPTPAWMDSIIELGPHTMTEEDQIGRETRIFKAFLKAYAKREGVTFAQLKNAIKAEL